MMNIKEQESMTITTALIQVIKQARDSHLSDEFWKNSEKPLAYLRNQLNLSNIQIVLISIMVEQDVALNWNEFAYFLDVTSFEIRTHAGELEELLEKGWVVKAINPLTDIIEYKLSPDASTALINNQAFVPTLSDTAINEESDNSEDIIDVNDTDEQDEQYDYEEESDYYILKKHTDIQEKRLYFNPTEQKQVQHLTSLLGRSKFRSIQRRLESEHMRKGFACLFYGGPGTGKTETVLQIARKTGRDIMQVDIAGLRSRFVGESIRNIREVFRSYRELCEYSETTPILFFNEADGAFNKRTTRIMQYCDKEENAMQNIILQEMENLNGILIATTNLTCNLDKAFERRFLYKLEFTKPTVEVKAKIWGSMLKNLSKKDALQLATKFDFSGGQIENVARKRTVDYILSGKYASLDDIENYCRLEILDQSEILNKKTERHHIAGFRA